MHGPIGPRFMHTTCTVKCSPERFPIPCTRSRTMYTFGLLTSCVRRRFLRSRMPPRPHVHASACVSRALSAVEADSGSTSNARPYTYKTFIITIVVLTAGVSNKNRISREMHGFYGWRSRSKARPPSIFDLQQLLGSLLCACIKPPVLYYVRFYYRFFIVFIRRHRPEESAPDNSFAHTKHGKHSSRIVHSRSSSHFIPSTLFLDELYKTRYRLGSVLSLVSENVAR